MKKHSSNFKIGLALGGGAALGFAHIGVLKVLEQNGIKIDYIAGSSMGSVMGALYASGMTPEEMYKEASVFDFKKITRINGFRIIKEGVYNTEKLQNLVEELTKIKLIEQTKIPFRCTSVDLLTGKEYIFKKGSIGQAVRASSAIPGLFNPVEKDGMFLVDGGVIDNIPFKVVKDMGADFVIAVDVLPKYIQKENVNNVVKVLMYSFGLMQNKYEHERRKILKDNAFVLEISSTKSEQDYSKSSIEYACKLGEEVALKNIDKIKRAIDISKKKFAKNNKKVS